jgi:hypothetical protein
MRGPIAGKRAWPTVKVLVEMLSRIKTPLLGCGPFFSSDLNSATGLTASEQTGKKKADLPDCGLSEHGESAVLPIGPWSHGCSTTNAIESATMQPTIVQNGALYQAQHRHTKQDRRHLRLRQTAGITSVKALRLSARAAKGLVPRNPYSLTMLGRMGSGTCI